jgi:hypothetical protein
MVLLALLVLREIRESKARKVFKESRESKGRPAWVSGSKARLQQKLSCLLPARFKAIFG